MTGATDIILEYVCPSLGCIMASLMFAAPVNDLRLALIRSSLGPLNPLPWAMMTGNCLGWVVYGYYTRDPFVLAANLPGLVLSIWLNSGAAKLQYHEITETKRRLRTVEDMPGDWDASPPVLSLSHLGGNADDSINIETHNSNNNILRGSTTRHLADDLPPNHHRPNGGEGYLVEQLSDMSPHGKQIAETMVLVPQEKALLRVLCLWSVVVVYVGWFSQQDPATTVGVVVNINLIFFYAAPLQTMWSVISTRNADSIHVPTMFMNWLNTSFWIAYGLARRDPVIIVPNGLGLLLGILQGLLRLFVSSGNNSSSQSVGSGSRESTSRSGHRHRRPRRHDDHQPLPQDDDEQETLSQDEEDDAIVDPNHEVV